MAGFAVAQAKAAQLALPACQDFAEQPTEWQTTLMYLEPFAWPAAVALLALAIIAAVLLLKMGQKPARPSLVSRRRGVFGPW